MACTYECCLELLLLRVQSTLDDLGTGQETLLEVLESLILDVNGGLLIERGLRVETELLQDGRQEVSALLFLLLVLVALLVLIHAVTSLLIDTLLEDP